MFRQRLDLVLAAVGRGVDIAVFVAHELQVRRIECDRFRPDATEAPTSTMTCTVAPVVGTCETVPILSTKRPQITAPVRLGSFIFGPLRGVCMLWSIRGLLGCVFRPRA
ncbi:MAG: hypothetical protein C0524_17990 [Rhodobacter sp.]|nr:hypothetical protein [Rhodobacter sp.]